MKQKDSVLVERSRMVDFDKAHPVRIRIDSNENDNSLYLLNKLLDFIKQFGLQHYKLYFLPKRKKIELEHQLRQVDKKLFKTEDGRKFQTLTNERAKLKKEIKGTKDDELLDTFVITVLIKKGGE